MPHGWTRWTIWQYSNRGRLPVDQNVFTGGPHELAALADPPLFAPLNLSGRIPSFRRGDDRDRRRWS
jgi:hypothetical protein